MIFLLEIIIFLIGKKCFSYRKNCKKKVEHVLIKNLNIGAIFLLSVLFVYISVASLRKN